MLRLGHAKRYGVLTHRAVVEEVELARGSVADGRVVSAVGAGSDVRHERHEPVAELALRLRLSVHPELGQVQSLLDVYVLAVLATHDAEPVIQCLCRSGKAETLMARFGDPAPGKFKILKPNTLIR